MEINIKNHRLQSFCELIIYGVCCCSIWTDYDDDGDDDAYICLPLLI